MSKRLLCVVVFLISTSAPALAQDNGEKEPSLDETIAWLKGKLKIELLTTGTTDSILVSNQFYSELLNSEGCAITLYTASATAAAKAANHVSISRRSTFFIHLGKLNPDGIDIDPFTSGKSELFQLTATAHNSEEVILEKYTMQVEKKDQKPKEKYTNSFSVVLDDEKLAERVAAALAHAIRLCGGTREIF